MDSNVNNEKNNIQGAEKEVNKGKKADKIREQTQADIEIKDYYYQKRRELFTPEDFVKFSKTDRFLQFVADAKEMRNMGKNYTLFEETIFMDKKAPKDLLSQVKPDKEASPDETTNAKFLQDMIMQTFKVADGIKKAVDNSNSDDSGEAADGEEKEAGGLVELVQGTKAYEKINQISTIAEPIVGAVSLAIAKAITNEQSKNIEQQNSEFRKVASKVGSNLRQFIENFHTENGVFSGEVGQTLETIFAPVTKIYQATKPVQDALAPWINDFEQQQLSDQQALSGHVKFTKLLQVDKFWEYEKDILPEHRVPKNPLIDDGEMDEIPLDEIVEGSHEDKLDDAAPINANSANHAQPEAVRTDIMASREQQNCFKQMHTTMTKKDCLNQLQLNLKTLESIEFYEEAEDANTKPKRRELSPGEVAKIYSMFHNLNYLYFQYNHLCTLDTDPSNHLQPNEYEEYPKSSRVTKNGSAMFFRVGKFLQDGFASREINLDIEDKEYEKLRDIYKDQRQKTQQEFEDYYMKNVFKTVEVSEPDNKVENKLDGQDKPQKKTTKIQTQGGVDADTFNIGSDFLILTKDNTYAEETEAVWDPKNENNPTEVPETLKSIKDNWKVMPSDILVSPELLVDEDQDRISGLQELKNKIASNREYENELYNSVINKKKEAIEKKYKDLIKNVEDRTESTVKPYQDKVKAAQDNLSKNPIGIKNKDALDKYKEELDDFNKTESENAGAALEVMKELLQINGGSYPENTVEQADNTKIKTMFMDYKDGAGVSSKATVLDIKSTSLKNSISGLDEEIEKLDKSIKDQENKRDADQIERLRLESEAADKRFLVGKLDSYFNGNSDSDIYNMPKEVSEALEKYDHKDALDGLKQPLEDVKTAAGELTTVLIKELKTDSDQSVTALFRMANAVNDLNIRIAPLKQHMEQLPNRTKTKRDVEALSSHLFLLNFSGESLVSRKRIDNESQPEQNQQPSNSDGQEDMSRMFTESPDNSKNEYQTAKLAPHEVETYYKDPAHASEFANNVTAIMAQIKTFVGLAYSSTKNGGREINKALGGNLSQACIEDLGRISEVLDRFDECEDILKKAQNFMDVKGKFQKPWEAAQRAGRNLMTQLRSDINQTPFRKNKVQTVTEITKKACQEQIDKFKKIKQEKQTEKEKLNQKLEYLAKVKVLLTTGNDLHNTLMREDKGYQVQLELDAQQALVDMGNQQLQEDKNRLDEEKNTELLAVETELDENIKKKHQKRLEVLKKAEEKVDKILEGAEKLKESEKALSDAAEKFGKAKKSYEQKFEKINQQRESNRINNEISWNEEMNSALESINNSGKKIGNDSSLYLTVVDEIRKFVGNKGERTKSEVWNYRAMKYKEKKPDAKLNEMLIYDLKDSTKWAIETKKLRKALDDYITARVRKKEKAKFTSLGQQRLDAVIRLRNILDARQNMLNLYEQETQEMENKKKTLDPDCVVEALVTNKLQRNKNLPVTDNNEKMIELLGGERSAKSLGIFLAVNPAQKKVPKVEAANHKKEGPAKKLEDKENKQRSKENKENKVVDKKKGGKAMGGPN